MSSPKDASTVPNTPIEVFVDHLSAITLAALRISSSRVFLRPFTMKCTVQHNPRGGGLWDKGGQWGVRAEKVPRG